MPDAPGDDPTDELAADRQGGAPRCSADRRWVRGTRRSGRRTRWRILRAQDASRVAELIPIRHARMAVSPWTYYRGAAAVMAADLRHQPNTGIEVQMCGDAHVLNFGLWATPERNLLFDLRDFDETLAAARSSGTSSAWRRASSCSPATTS